MSQTKRATKRGRKQLPHRFDRLSKWRQDAILNDLCQDCHAKLDTDTRRCSACLSKARTRATEYSLENRERIRRRARERTRRVRERVIAKYGGKCQCPGCGISQYEFLAIDHVNGGGCRERRKKRFYNSQAFYNYLDKHQKLAKYQILCHNCNSAKSFYGGCPHITGTMSPAPLVILDGKLYVGRACEPYMIPAVQSGISSLRLN